MKRKVLVMFLALLLCVSLCACGSYRANEGMNDNGMTNNGNNGTGADRAGGSYNGTGSNGTNGNGMNNQDMDVMPDAEDGFVDDNNGDNGILDGELSMPSPNVTQRP